MRSVAPGGGSDGPIPAVRNAEWAKPGDVAAIEDGLRKLPPACAASNAYAERDGTVTMNVICAGGGKATDGSVSVRDGVVRKLR